MTRRNPPSRARAIARLAADRQRARRSLSLALSKTLAPALLTMLAACSAEEPAPQAEEQEPAVQASAPASPPPGPAVLTEVPAAFQGYWDGVDGQCATWSDAQLTIKPDSLIFYESMGEVTAVRQPDAETIVVSMAMSGEGDSWTEETTYRLLDGGTVLESNFTEADGGEPFRRKRCDALVEVSTQ